MAIDPYAGPPDEEQTPDEVIAWCQYMQKLDLRAGRKPDPQLVAWIAEARERKAALAAFGE